MNDAPNESNDVALPNRKVPSVEVAASTSTSNNGGTVDANDIIAEKPKPMRRKLFAPPALFPDAYIDSFNGTLPTTKTDTKKTSAAKTAQKRKRTDVSVEIKRKPVADAPTKSVTTKSAAPQPNGRPSQTVSRRSTLCFVTPPIKTTKPASKPAKPTARKSMMVYTSMHQPQIDFIKEVRHG